MNGIWSPSNLREGVIFKGITAAGLLPFNPSLGYRNALW